MSGSTPSDSDGDQVWEVGPIGRVLCTAPLLSLTVLTLFGVDDFPLDDSWLLFIGLAVISVLVMRPAVRITQDELVIRHFIGSDRMPRSDVASAKFTYFGLMIYRRDGGSSIAFIQPKLTSTELSGDEPPPDSAAYRITTWAQHRDE